MNILYIGYKDKYDVDILIALSNKHSVDVLSQKECYVETGCNYIVTDIISRENFDEKKYDIAIIKEEEYTAESIGEILHLCALGNIEKVIILRNSDLFSQECEGVDISVMLAQEYFDNVGLDVSVVQVPCLYGDDLPPKLVEISRDALIKNKITIEKTNIVEILHIDDFCDFFVDALNDCDNLFDKRYVLLQGSFPLELDSFVQLLKDRYNGVEISYLENERKIKDKIIADSKRININSRNGFKDVDALLKKSEERVYEKGLNKKKSIGGSILKLGILAFLFAIISVYTVLAPSGAELQYIDFRFIFIVFAALIFGENYGYLAAGLCSVLFVFEKLYNGTAWYTLFYNVNNWITVIVYIVSAMVLGMILSRQENQKK